MNGPVFVHDTVHFVAGKSRNLLLGWEHYYYFNSSWRGLVLCQLL